MGNDKIYWDADEVYGKKPENKPMKLIPTAEDVYGDIPRSEPMPMYPDADDIYGPKSDISYQGESPRQYYPQPIPRQLTQHRDGIADIMLKLLVGFIVIAYLFQLIIMPWIYSHPIETATAIIAIIATVYIAGYMAKRVVGGVIGGIEGSVIRVIREIKK